MSDNLNNNIPPAINRETKPVNNPAALKRFNRVVKKANDENKRIAYSLQETVKEFSENQKKLNSVDVSDSLEKVQE